MYKLVIGNKNYSSWSMRAWMLLKHVGAPFEEITVDLYRDGAQDVVRSHGGETGLVPVLIDEGFPIWDTLAIFEHVHERYPTVWPASRQDRARARSLSGEVHSSLNALRAAMPVNTRARHRIAQRTPAVEADIERIVRIWSSRPDGGTWLFGEFSGADIMFAPVAARFRTYGVELSGKAKDYLDALLAHPLAEQWFALGAAETDVIDIFELPVRAGMPPRG